MLDVFYYESGFDGSVVYFGKNGIFANYNTLRDYSWETGYSSIRTMYEKELPVVFSGENRKETEQIRNDFFRIIERDVVSKKKGKIHVNGFYLECFITASSNEEYLFNCQIKTTYTIKCEDPSWKKETLFRFNKIVSSEQDGFDYSMVDFPYDVGKPSDSNQNSINHDSIGDADFIITVYGECVNPNIEINSKHYSVNGTVPTGEKLVITSGIKKTIEKIATDGSVVNWFGKRNKESSVFDKIPSGKSIVSWDGSFTFEITLIDKRSEPEWGKG